MASSNIFSASLSGLNAAMYEMNTTQNNIANASTPGYTRQQVTLTAQSVPASSGSGFIGQGVNVTGVVRLYNQFLTSQVLQQQGQASYLTTYLSSMTQVNNLVSNATSGVSTTIQAMFDAVNGLANAPDSIPARQTVLSAGQAAVNSFQSMSQGLSSISTSLNGQIASSVQQINTFATQIATLNSSITSAIASGNGQQPNSLLDQRDQLVSQLNQQIGATTQMQPDGTMSVFVGSGQALVVGNQAMALQVVQNPNDPSKQDVAYLNNGKTTTIQQSSLQGGNLGAYMTFRDQSLQPAQNALGLVALGLAANINQQNQLGQDKNGAPGAALMSIATPVISAGASNTGTGSVSAAISNVSAMTASDYQLKFNGSSYSLTRLSDNTVTQLGSALPLSKVVDGVTVSVAAPPGAMIAGDSFLIRPTANAAAAIAMTTTDPTKVAAALPFNGTSSIKASMTAEPTTTVSSGAITDASVTVAGTTPSTDIFTVDGKTLLSTTVAAGAVVPGPLNTAAGLDAAWPGFATANPGYTLTGSFTAGTAQITKTDGTAVVLADTLTTGIGATITPFAAAGAGFMGTTLPSKPNTTAASGLISGTVVSGVTTTPATGTFTVDGKTLFTSTIPASTPAAAAGTLITGAQLDTAWAAFQTANPGYSLVPGTTFAAGTAQIVKADGTAVTLATAISGGAGGVITPFAAATAGFMGTTPGSKVAAITVNNPNNTSLTNPVSITFSSPTQYTVTGAVPSVSGPQTYDPVAGTISYNGWTMQLTGSTSVPGGMAPVAGDVFTVGANSAAATVSNGSYNQSPVSINFTSATAYNVVETTGSPPATVTIGTGTYTAPGPNTVSYNGWTTQISGAPATGDVFNIAKGSNAGSMLATAAAANSGAGTISGGAFSVQPFTIMFNNPATSYTVSGATPAVTGSVPYVAGQDISYNGWTMKVTGTPVAGDVFNVAPNTNGTGDNRNALLMVGLQNQNLMSNGTTTFIGQFGQMVGAIGAKTSELTTTSTAQTTMVAQTVAAQQSVSGVNLDEEAANLLQYQRAYQASAKAMQIANTMFDALLTLR